MVLKGDRRSNGAGHQLGYLFDGSPSGPLLDLIDLTYAYGFGRLQGQLPPHTYGGYPGYSTGYNAGYGSAGLRGSHYRSEGIYDYEFMITNTMSAPFSCWENILNVGKTIWSPQHARDQWWRVQPTYRKRLKKERFSIQAP